MSMNTLYDDFDEVAFQVNIEGVEQDEEPIVDWDESDEDHDEDPYDRSE